MKFRYFALCLFSMAAAAGLAKSDKRGVSENQFSMGSMLEALEPGVSWYYNWGNTPGKGFENQVIDYEGIEFVPMCWNANYNADAIREYCKTHPATKYLLGFNEPNFTAQANMTPQKAAEEWPKVKALADELGLKLVAPALNYSPNPPYTNPLKWMDEFVALVGLDAFDFTAVHNYGGLGVMKTLAGNFHDRYGKDVWVTEFCYWPNEGNQYDHVTPETQIQSMIETVEWLESTPWIYRYAWFKALGNSSSNSGPNYGLLVHEGAGTDPWGLSEQGKVYVGLGDFDSDKWLEPGHSMDATDFISSNLISLGSTRDSRPVSGIEISRFNSGANVTWQFNVPQTTDYYFTLGLSGYGEPTRFDPQLQLFIVDGDSETAVSDILKPTLPNSETEYIKYSTVVALPAGHVQLRLKDVAPFQPSGIRISTVRLDDVAGVGETVVEAVKANSVIYNMQGLPVGKGAESFSNLPRGIYIIDGKKIAKTL